MNIHDGIFLSVLAALSAVVISVAVASFLLQPSIDDSAESIDRLSTRVAKLDRRLDAVEPTRTPMGRP